MQDFGKHKSRCPRMLIGIRVVPSITHLAFKQVLNKFKQVSSKFQVGSPHNLPYCSCFWDTIFTHRMSHYWIVAPILGRDWQDIFLLEYKYTKYILFGPNIDKFRVFSGKYVQLDQGELNLNLNLN